MPKNLACLSGPPAGDAGSSLTVGGSTFLVAGGTPASARVACTARLGRPPFSSEREARRHRMTDEHQNDAEWWRYRLIRVRFVPVFLCRAADPTTTRDGLSFYRLHSI